MKNLILLGLFFTSTIVLFNSCDKGTVGIAEGLEDVNVVLSVADSFGTPASTTGWPVEITAIAWSEAGNSQPSEDYYIHIFSKKILANSDEAFNYETSEPLSYNTELNFSVSLDGDPDAEGTYKIYAIANETTTYSSSDGRYDELNSLPDDLKYTLEIYCNN